MLIRRFDGSGAILAVAVILAACSAAPEASQLASASATTSPSPTASASETASPAPSLEPSASDEEGALESSDDGSAGPGDGLAGIGLTDTDVEMLLQALQNYGFTFEPPDSAGGETLHVGEADDGAVTVTVTERDGVPVELIVSDESGESLAGIDDIGFIVGIFAPEAERWLFESLETALGDPASPFEASADFDFVTLELAAFTDARGALDLTVTDR